MDGLFVSVCLNSRAPSVLFLLAIASLWTATPHPSWKPALNIKFQCVTEIVGDDISLSSNNVALSPYCILFSIDLVALSADPVGVSTHLISITY